MTSTPLVLGTAEKVALDMLAMRAIARPVQMTDLLERLKTPEGKRAHMDQMGEQTVELPFGFLVTYSIEMHPIGLCRHMSMTSPVAGRMPTPEAVQWICSALGFTGVLFDGSQRDLSVWVEDLTRDAQQTRAKAVNVVQPIAAAP